MTNTSESRAGSAARTGHIECTLQTDPRLIAAVGPIITNAAERAELPDAARAELAAAVVEACRKMFPDGGSATGAIRVEVTELADRVEVILEAVGKPAASRNSPDGSHGGLQDLKVERTRCEVGEGRARLTLTKQCGEAKSSQTA